MMDWWKKASSLSHAHFANIFEQKRAEANTTGSQFSPKHGGHCGVVSGAVIAVILAGAFY